MKLLQWLFCFSFFIFSLGSYAQDLDGTWKGALSIQGFKLPLFLHIQQHGDSLSATADSPMQGAKDIPVSRTVYEDSTFSFEISDIGAKYKGRLSDGKTIVGVFEQNGQSLPLTLKKTDLSETTDTKSYEPSPPYPYYTEEVQFPNETDQITLAGTLSLPSKEGKFPAVILISGSGPQDRDEEVFGHKTFLVIADYLSRNGIAVLRYDDRGVGVSTGNFPDATSYDFEGDAQSALSYLRQRKEIDRDKIGIIGHSEGGVIAPMVASKDHEIDYIILLAGPSLPGDSILLLQKKLIETKMGINESIVESGLDVIRIAYEIIKNEDMDSLEIADSLSYYFSSHYGSELSQNKLTELIRQLTSPWMIEFIRIDPADYLSEVASPILALYGSKDVQVPAQENIDKMKKIKANSENKMITIKEIEGVNHLFQNSETGMIEEYPDLLQSPNDETLEVILDFIKNN